MKCRHREKEIILYYWRELSPDKEKRLRGHFETCSFCRQKLAEIESFFKCLHQFDRRGANEAGRSVDWEKTWQAIEQSLIGQEIVTEERQKTEQQSARRRSQVFNWRWLFLHPQLLFIAAALFLAFLGGLFIGRFLIFKSSASSPAIALAEMAPPASFNEHLEELWPFLVSIVNFDEDQISKLALNPSYVRSLMLQNMLLRRLLSERNPQVAALLSDLEIILRELSHLDTFDNKMALYIRDFIKKNSLLFQIELLRKSSEIGGL